MCCLYIVNDCAYKTSYLFLIYCHICDKMRYDNSVFETILCIESKHMVKIITRWTNALTRTAVSLWMWTAQYRRNHFKQQKSLEWDNGFAKTRKASCTWLVLTLTFTDETYLLSVCRVLTFNYTKFHSNLFRIFAVYCKENPYLKQQTYLVWNYGFIKLKKASCLWLVLTVLTLTTFH